MKILWILIAISLSLWANIGTIMAIKGNANVQRDSGLIRAQNGMPLMKSDTILTKKRSRVQVMLDDETVVTIGANSSFAFEDFLFDGTKKSQVKMRAIRGFFRSVTGKIGKIAPERFKVRTASATIGIRGTDFSGNIVGDKEVFRCYKGKIYVKIDGVKHNIKAGMMLELFANKIMIHKMQHQRKGHQKTLQKKGNRKRANTKAMKLKISSLSKPLNSIKSRSIVKNILPIVVDIVKDTKIQRKPFNITPTTEDRQITY